MADTTLRMEFSDLAAAVGDYLGKGRTSTNWSATDTTRIGEIVNTGYKRFLFPMGAAPAGFTWSFMRPILSLDLLSGQSTYEFPSYVEAVPQGFWYRDYPTLRVHVCDDVMTRSYASTSGRPLLVSMEVAMIPGATEPMRRARFFPTPNGSYALEYRAFVIPPALSATAPHPMCGAIHSDTLLESCLAAAELSLNDQAGIHQAAYMAKLQMSIALDATLHRPSTLGRMPRSGDDMVRLPRVGALWVDGVQVY